MVKAVHERREMWRKLDVRGAWGENGLRIAWAFTRARWWWGDRQ